jgi:hypothetical protein
VEAYGYFFFGEKVLGVMGCYACSARYGIVKLLPNRTLELSFSEEMCQTIQNVCADYTRLYVDLAEKAKYLSEWIRTE